MLYPGYIELTPVASYMQQAWKGVASVDQVDALRLFCPSRG